MCEVCYGMGCPCCERVQVCPQCDTIMEETDTGTYKKQIWREYTCPDCGHSISDEPDYETE
jgi:primosomal protein N'